MRLSVALLVTLLATLAYTGLANSSVVHFSVQGRQLWAVRGEIIDIKPRGAGTLAVSVQPAQGFNEATVLIRENDQVGSAIRRASEVDLLGLLSGDGIEEETISGAELEKGDFVSVIYDPQSFKAIEVYRRH